MTRPTEAVPTPFVVTDIAAGRTVAPVWVNELGGVTFTTGGGSEYVKVTPPQWAHGLGADVCRLGWAATYLRVPRVLGAGDGWIHTAGLPGSSAIDPRWMDDPRTAARAIGAGLALMHATLPVGDWRDEFFDAYGVAPDQDRMDHYLRMWEDVD